MTSLSLESILQIEKGTEGVTVDDEYLTDALAYCDFVGANGTPPISTGQLAAISRELLTLRSARAELCRLAKIGLAHDGDVVSADGWIEWHGGECPVPDLTRVDVKHRDGRQYSDVQAWGKKPDGLRVESGSKAGYAFWHNDDAAADIIAYRIATSIRQGAKT